MTVLTTEKRPDTDSQLDPLPDSVGPEVSIVMPCLNESETLAACIEKAQRGLRENGIDGEIIVADNGSTDGSQELAEKLGARVVRVEARGYGNALHGGIAAARGRYVIMGDSDDSYDFSSIGPFVEKLREGHELVMGNRFRGGIRPGAMPWKHRWIGNPVLSGLGRLFFRCPAGDFHCGLRGFTRASYDRMQLRTTGMEFASEMVIKATMLRLRIAEVPTVLHPDGRSRPPHLRSWRDGWRHLRFMLLFSPRWLFLYPGLLMFTLGLVSAVLLSSRPWQVGPATFDIGTLLVSGVVCLLGHQLIVFAFFTKIFAVTMGFHSRNTNLNLKIFRSLSLEAGLVAGLVLTAAGLFALGTAAWDWRMTGFGAMDPRSMMRHVIPAMILLTLGVQTIFGSFFLGILTLGRK